MRPGRVGPSGRSPGAAQPQVAKGSEERTKLALTQRLDCVQNLGPLHIPSSAARNDAQLLLELLPGGWRACFAPWPGDLRDIAPPGRLDGHPGERFRRKAGLDLRIEPQ
jgi:hypothetical protein